MLSQITDSVWMIEVGDKLHWDDCKKIGTMDEWNQAIEHFNNKHNENFISSIFTNHIHTVVKMFYLPDSTDSEDEEEGNYNTDTNPPYYCDAGCGKKVGEGWDHDCDRMCPDCKDEED